MDIGALRDTGIALSTDPLDLHAARRDLWPRNSLRLRQGELPDAPAVVAWPTTHADVEAAVAWAVQNGVAVVPYGAGSGVCGAAAGRAGSLVLDLKRMRRILRVDTDARVAICQAGMLGQHVEDQLAELGFMTAHSPSSIMCSTIGGYVASRSAGQFSSSYGVFVDMLLGARAVTPRGTLLGGAWCPTGEEDLLPVLAGSEGALGVITEAMVRIAPLPAQRWLRGYAFHSLEAAWDAMRGLMQADLWPSVLRLYDPVDTRVGGPARAAERASSGAGPSWFQRVGDALAAIPGLRGRALELPLALPKLVNRLAGHVGQEVLLIVGFEGSGARVRAVTEAARGYLSEARDLGAAPGQHWFAHRHDVSYKLAPIFAGGGWADTMEVAAPWSRLGELHQGVRRALGQHAVVMAHFSHAYPEGCSIYFSFAGGGTLESYDAAWGAGLRAARECGGTVTHHHGVGQLKAAEAAREYGAAVRVWREVKGNLDPTGIMNPGRLFPADVDEVSGPARPEGGPVFRVDRTSLLADVDPAADLAAVEAALLEKGLALRIRPDRAAGPWLARLRSGVLQRWEAPLFAVQVRFEDGVSVRLGGAPRSAAGPDLRWALLRRATPEVVQLPVRLAPKDAGIYTVHRKVPEGADAEDLRPAWREGDRWGFAGPAAAALAEAAGGEATHGGAPRRSATAVARLPPAPSDLPVPVRPPGASDDAPGAGREA